MKQAPVLVVELLHQEGSASSVGERGSSRVRLYAGDDEVHPEPGRWFGLHGAGVVGGNFVTSVEDLRQAGLAADLEDPGRLGASISGSLTLYGVDQQGRILVLPDPLGSGLVFRFRSSGIDAISSDLSALVERLRRYGLKPEKSLPYVVLLAATGSGGLGQTPFEGVETVSAGTWYQVSNSGVVEQSYPPSSLLVPGQEDYETGLERARLDLLNNVRAVAEYGSAMKICHLTGGSDSRLVAAALRHTGADDDFLFYCMGGAGDPDFDLASRIAAALPLRMTPFSGYVERNESTSWQDFTVGALNATAGVLQTLATVWGVRSETTVLSGGYGEFLRSFYNQGKPADLPLPALAEHMFGQFSMGQDDERCIIAKPLKTSLLEQLDEAIAEGLARGVGTDAVLDYLYMTGRNRFFVGEISRVVSDYSNRFDPLYSVAAARSSLSLPGELRNANLFGLDLLQALDPLLAAMPFDRERYAGVYERVRGPVARVALHDRQPHRVPKPLYALKPGGEERIPLAWRSPQPTAAQTAEARRLQMAPRLIANYEHIRKEIPRMLGEIAPGKTAESLNLTLLHRHLQRPPSHRVIYRSLTNLYGGLSWYLYGDSLGQACR